MKIPDKTGYINEGFRFGNFEGKPFYLNSAFVIWSFGLIVALTIVVRHKLAPDGRTLSSEKTIYKTQNII